MAARGEQDTLQFCDKKERRGFPAALVIKINPDVKSITKESCQCSCGSSCCCAVASPEDKCIVSFGSGHQSVQLGQVVCSTSRTNIQGVADVCPECNEISNSSSTDVGENICLLLLRENINVGYSCCAEREVGKPDPCCSVIEYLDIVLDQTVFWGSQGVVCKNGIVVAANHWSTETDGIMCTWHRGVPDGNVPCSSCQSDVRGGQGRKQATISDYSTIQWNLI